MVLLHFYDKMRAKAMQYDYIYKEMSYILVIIKMSSAFYQYIHL